MVRRGPGRLRAYIWRAKGGSSRRLSVADMMRAVTTTAEKVLYWELYPTFTKGSRTDWAGMTREWNLRVADSLTAGGPVRPQLFLKREHQLRQYEKTVGKLIKERDSSTLLHAVGLPSYTVPTSAQLTLDSLLSTLSAPLAPSVQKQSTITGAFQPGASLAPSGSQPAPGASQRPGSSQAGSKRAHPDNEGDDSFRGGSGLGGKGGQKLCNACRYYGLDAEGKNAYPLVRVDAPHRAACPYINRPKPPALKAYAGRPDFQKIHGKYYDTSGQPRKKAKV